mmetsp:Transcript_1481/g.1948  ORF Transcript_1481/g.1948 Transcript_1481/m.1948 type:complete len:181 (+) Transcript_1481:41-583(+)
MLTGTARRRAASVAPWFSPRRSFVKRIEMFNEDLMMNEKERAEWMQKKRQEKMKKRSSSKKGGGAAKDEFSDPRVVQALYKQWMDFLKPTAPPPDLRTQEQLQLDKNFAQDYAKLVWIEKKEQSSIEQRVLDSKLAAIAALPPKLQEAALIQEGTPFPLTHMPPALYPANYDPSDPNKID